MSKLCVGIGTSLADATTRPTPHVSQHQLYVCNQALHLQQGKGINKRPAPAPLTANNVPAHPPTAPHRSSQRAPLGRLRASLHTHERTTVSLYHSEDQYRILHLRANIHHHLPRRIRIMLPPHPIHQRLRLHGVQRRLVARQEAHGDAVARFALLACPS